MKVVTSKLQVGLLVFIVENRNEREPPKLPMVLLQRTVYKAESRPAIC